MVKSKSEPKQLDIVAAFRGKDETLADDDDIQEQVQSTKKLTIFDFVTDIRKNKRMNLLDNEENLGIWNSYMILQALSMKEDDIPICNLINKYTGTLSKKQMYQLLGYVIPRDSGFHKWIKKSSNNNNSDDVNYISKYYECSLSEANDYISIMGEDWVQQIKSKFGGEVTHQTISQRKGKK